MIEINSGNMVHKPLLIRSLGKSVRENVRHLTKRFHEHFCLGTLHNALSYPSVVPIVILGPVYL